MGDPVLFYLLVGAVAGFASGLMGIGGGVLMVPAVYLATGSMVAAIATSLAASCLMSGAASFSHFKREAIDSRALTPFAPGLLLGCMGGAFLSLLLSPETLRLLFAILLSLVALVFLANSFPQSRARIYGSALSFWGMGIGAVATLLGVGGGIFVVPLFKFYGMHTRIAIGTSAFCTFLTTLVGSLSFLALRGDAILPLPFFCLSVSALLTASLGVKAAQILPTSILKRLMGLVLLAIAYTI